MQRKQWAVLAIAFFILMVYFINEDHGFQNACGVAGIPPEHYTAEKWLEIGSEPVSRVDLWCINTEIYDPFIHLFGVMFFVCLINGWLEKKT